MKMFACVALLLFLVSGANAQYQGTVCTEGSGIQKLLFNKNGTFMVYGGGAPEINGTYSMGGYDENKRLIINVTMVGYEPQTGWIMPDEYGIVRYAYLGGVMFLYGACSI